MKISMIPLEHRVLLLELASTFSRQIEQLHSIGIIVSVIHLLRVCIQYYTSYDNNNSLINPPLNVA